MTRHRTLCLAAALGAAAGPAFGQVAQPAVGQGAVVTYVGNSGFLISAGGRKILIDALFDGFRGGYVPPPSVNEPLRAGRAPFDGIDLILATHDHGDHFGAAAVRRALESNPEAVFVGPSATVSALGGFEGRTIALEVPGGQRRSLEVRGISIAAMPLSHGMTRMVNLGYVVTVAGVKFLHTGDAAVEDIPIPLLRTLGLPDERIDVAFVTHFVLSSRALLPREWVTEGLRPRTVVASHYRYTEPPDTVRIRRNFPTAVVFGREGESWVVR